MFETIKTKYQQYKTKAVSYYQALTETARIGFWIVVSILMAVFLVVGIQVFSFIAAVIQIAVVIGVLLGVAYLLTKELRSWKSKQ